MQVRNDNAYIHTFSGVGIFSFIFVAYKFSNLIIVVLSSMNSSKNVIFVFHTFKWVIENRNVHEEHARFDSIIVFSINSSIHLNIIWKAFIFLTLVQVFAIAGNKKSGGSESFDLFGRGHLRHHESIQKQTCEIW